MFSKSHKHTHTHTHRRKSQKEWCESRVVVSVTQFGGSTMLFQKADVGAPIFSNSLGSDNSFEVRQPMGMTNTTVTPYGCFLPFLRGSFQLMTVVVSSSLANVCAYTLLLHALRLDLRAHRFLCLPVQQTDHPEQQSLEYALKLHSFFFSHFMY
jgi:hypothetical protein